MGMEKIKSIYNAIFHQTCQMLINIIMFHWLCRLTEEEWSCSSNLINYTINYWFSYLRQFYVLHYNTFLKIYCCNISRFFFFPGFIYIVSPNKSYFLTNLIYILSTCYKLKLWKVIIIYYNINSIVIYNVKVCFCEIQGLINKSILIIK